MGKNDADTRKGTDFEKNDQVAQRDVGEHRNEIDGAGDDARGPQTKTQVPRFLAAGQQMSAAVEVHDRGNLIDHLKKTQNMSFAAADVTIEPMPSDTDAVPENIKPMRNPHAVVIGHNAARVVVGHVEVLDGPK